MTCLRTEMRALASEGLFSRARGPGARVGRGSVSLLAVGVGCDRRRERSGGLMTLRPLRRLRQGSGAISAARLGPSNVRSSARPPARASVASRRSPRVGVRHSPSAGMGACASRRSRGVTR